VLLSWGVLLPSLGAAQPPAGADEQLAIARTLYLEEGPAAALPAYEQTLAAYMQEGDRLGEAITLGLMGNCHKRFGDYEKALELLGTALEMKRELADRTEEATTLSHLGLVYWEMGEYERAIARFEASSEIGRELGDAELQGINLNNLSLVYDELGDYPRSLEGYGRALAIYRETGFVRGESDTLGNIGGVHLLLGRYRQALDHYQQSLDISEREGFIYSMSLDHGNLALAKLGLGQTREALTHFDRALELAEEAGATQDEAYWLKGKGQALVTLGRIDEGLDLLRQSVERSEETGSKAEMIEGLHELGDLYAELGDAVLAERQLRRSVETAREIGLARGVTSGLLALGDLEWRRERYEQAAALYEEAGRRAEEAGEQGQMAESLLRRSRMHRNRNLLDKASDEAEQALLIARQTAARATEAKALLARGEIDRMRGRIDESLERYSEAETVALEVDAPDLVWRIKHGQGRALERAARLPEAADALEQAVAIIESVRNRLREERFRAGYLQDKYQVYLDLVRVLLASGKVEKAFTSAERLRARSYLELIHRGTSQAGTDEQHRLEIELRGRVRQLRRVSEEEGEKEGEEFRQSALRLFSDELVAAEAEYQALLDDLRQTDPAAADLRSLVVPTAAQIQASLPPGAALLEYLLYEDSLIIFVVTPESVRSREVAAGRLAIEARVELLRDLVLRTDSAGWRRPAAALANLLIRPVTKEGWLEGAEQLLIVPHGILHYLPFGTLVLGDDPEGRLLIEEYDLAVLPAATAVTRPGPRRSAAVSMLALAPGRANLRFAPEEVERVSEYFDSDSLVLVGDAARESVFKSLAGDYGVLHLASHGYFNKLNPLLSGLELEPDETDDGYLEVHEILGLDLSAELVTLSACDTALASGHFAGVPAGEEFVGLTRAFLSSGSGAVLSTLWQVSDRSTVAMMQDFYSRLSTGERSTSLARALGEAQRSMLRGERYAHPYFWAPFILVGGEDGGPDQIAELLHRRP